MPPARRGRWWGWPRGQRWGRRSSAGSQSGGKRRSPTPPGGPLPTASSNPTRPGPPRWTTAPAGFSNSPGGLRQGRRHVSDIAEGHHRRALGELKTVGGVQLWCGKHRRLPAAVGQVLHGVITLAVVDQIGPVQVQSEAAPTLADLFAPFGDAAADIL